MKFKYVTICQIKSQIFLSIKPLYRLGFSCFSINDITISALLRLTLTILLTSHIANSFGRPLSQVTVCTIFSLLKPPPTVLISFVRDNIHTCFPLFSIRSLNTLISIVVYLNMYNPLIVILRFFSSVHIARFMLCVLYFPYFVYSIVIPPCNSVQLSYWIKGYLLTYLLYFIFCSPCRLL